MLGSCVWREIDCAAGSSFLGAITKFRKATQLPQLCLSVRLSAWKTGLPLDGFFYEILYLNIFRISVEGIQVSLKSDKNSGHFT
jgi:hypothetical protein